MKVKVASWTYVCLCACAWVSMCIPCACVGVSGWQVGGGNCLDQSVIFLLDIAGGAAANSFLTQTAGGVAPCFMS